MHSIALGLVLLAALEEEPRVLTDQVHTVVLERTSGVEASWIELSDGLLVVDPAYPLGVEETVHSLEPGTPVRWVVAGGFAPETTARSVPVTWTLVAHDSADVEVPHGGLRFSERLELADPRYQVRILPAGAPGTARVEVESEAGEVLRIGEPARTRLSETEFLGSLRGGRVAIPMPADEPREVVFFGGSLDETTRRELSEAVPNLRLVLGLSRDEALARAGEAHGIDARYASSEFFRAAPNLRWVQSMSAGVDRYVAIEELARDDDIVLTNMKTAHGPTIADHCFAMLLSLTRDLESCAQARRDKAWRREGSGKETVSLDGKTLLVCGLGGIGTQVAKRGKGFGMHVLGTVRTLRPAPDFVDELHPGDDLDELLPRADVVAICLPLTDETGGLFNAGALARMKPGSILINVGRGKIVDSDALLAALKGGHLAGACLDVTDPEPLPSEHPLWDAPNLVLTPHVSGRAETTTERRTILLRENLRRFAAGEPLVNVVDKQAGY